MTYLVGYAALLLVIGVIDGVWLTYMGPTLYRPVLGDMLLTNIRIAPAILFYLMFPVGVMVFAVLPGVRSGSPLTAAGYGLLFGAIAYATYDLTNYATLKNWTLQLTVLDIVYGALLSGLAAVAAFYAMRAAASWAS